MQKVKDLNEVIDLLKDRYILKGKANTYFSLVKNRVMITRNGSRFSLSIDEFKELYLDETFYLIEDDQVVVDHLKDEEYYAFKHK